MLKIISLSRFSFFLIVLLLTGIFGSQEAKSQELMLADTTTACFADSVLLDAGEGFQSYLWSTDQQTQTIFAADTGWYYVWVTLENMDVLMDSTWVFFQNAGIQQPDTIQTCYTYPVTLCVEPDTLMYFWYSNDPEAIIENDTAACVEIIPENDTTTVYVAISDSLGYLTCIDSVQIWLYPRMVFKEANQISMGCPATCRGQLEVIVEGGLPPYSYIWPDAPIIQYDSIAFGLCERDYTIEVTDQYLCKRDTAIFVEVFEMPDVEAYYEGPKGEKNENVYIQNPVVTFRFDNASAPDIEVIDWNWDFGDTTYTKEFDPVKVYDQVREFDVWLKYTTDDECVDSTTLKVNVDRIRLVIPNVITPNGDPYNQFFAIDSLEHYISNDIKIFNRTGKQVYSRRDYQGDWDAENLREGVYFYVLEAVGYFGTDRFQGTITVMR
jgi:gliding motility-associated-like protein